MWYQSLDIFFFCFHTSLILFNVFGWMFSRTRKWNLLTLTITAFSWFVFGIWYGWGYCFCTDWHWAVREHLGFTDMSHSYNHFLLLQLTGINFSVQLVDRVTAIVFIVSFALSGILNLRDFQKKGTSIRTGG